MDPMTGPMTIRVLLLVACCAGTAAAATVDGHEWPPDPKRYDAPGTEIAPGLKIGDTLDEKNADRAKELLPPEILRHYERGEYRNEIASWPAGLIYRERSFDEATRKNETRLEWDVYDVVCGVICRATTRIESVALLH